VASSNEDAAAWELPLTQFSRQRFAASGEGHSHITAGRKVLLTAQPVLRTEPGEPGSGV